MLVQSLLSKIKTNSVLQEDIQNQNFLSAIGAQSYVTTFTRSIFEFIAIDYLISPYTKQMA